MADAGVRFESRDADRRQARRRRGGHVRQHQSRQRGGARRGRRRVEGRHASAIDAARRAFDETDWSTNHAFRKRCLRSCRTRSRPSRRSCARSSSSRSAARARSPTARSWTRRWPTACVSGQADRRVPMGDGPRRRVVSVTGSEHHAEGVARTRRCRRRHRAVELPVRGHHQQARAGPRHRQHGGAQARARHAVQRHADRPAHRRADRHPAGRPQRRDRLGPLRRRGAHAVAARST